MSTAAGSLTDTRAGTLPTGLTLDRSGGTLRVYSRSADALELCVFDPADPDAIAATVPMCRDDDVWTAHSPLLSPGARYALRARGPAGPQHSFDAHALLIDPYARGLDEVAPGEWRSVVVDGAFDWDGVERPRVPLDRTVIYEAHTRGLTRLAPGVPEHLRGSYAALAHPATIEHLVGLGITAVELLPVQAFCSERRLVRQGLTNYWGYNTLGYFAPHAPYASPTARAAGADAVLHEFKEMVRGLHESGIEVILDVVYNHTAEEGADGPRLHLRGLDNASYYRQTATGRYIDETGCGNTLDFSKEAARRLTLDSLRYWADEVKVDGFRFDLAVTLGRGSSGAWDPQSDFLASLTADPSLEGVKLIAEPWDVGPGGWQTGGFPDGWSEWNDRFRDRTRDFWLGDIAATRREESHQGGAGAIADALSGSASMFADRRGPLASVGFVTAHDGFTLADLVSYNTKHNLANGEDNRDGSDSNRSFNFGIEGPTEDPAIAADRRRAQRTLLGTLLVSSGIPMITAGDEVGRTQRGNNNAYCRDDETTWMSWDWDAPQRDLYDTVARLLRLRLENPALRLAHFGGSGDHVSSANQLDWFRADGARMDHDAWHDPARRTIQLLATATADHEEPNRILLIVHGSESTAGITLPAVAGTSGYVPLWDSTDERPALDGDPVLAGTTVALGSTSMRLYRVLPTV